MSRIAFRSGRDTNAPSERNLGNSDRAWLPSVITAAGTVREADAMRIKNFLVSESTLRYSDFCEVAVSGANGCVRECPNGGEALGPWSREYE